MWELQQGLISYVVDLRIERFTEMLYDLRSMLCLTAIGGVPDKSVRAMCRESFPSVSI